MTNANQMHRTDAAGERLGVSGRTLEKWRQEGRGPDFVKVGKLCLYTEAALVEFVERNTVRRSAA